MLYFVIYDTLSGNYLTDKNGGLCCFSTISDCIDYLEYVLKVCEHDFNNYSFILKQR